MTRKQNSTNIDNGMTNNTCKVWKSPIIHTCKLREGRRDVIELPNTVSESFLSETMQNLDCEY